MRASALALMAAVLVVATQQNEQRKSSCTLATDCASGMVPVRREGTNLTVWVVWQSGPDRAAGALLLRVLEAYRYCSLSLCEAPTGVCQLLTDLSSSSDTSLVVGIESNGRLKCKDPRPLNIVGSKRAPLRPRLHAALSTKAASLITCAAAAADTFYHHDDELRLCDFNLSASEPRLRAYVPNDWANTNDIATILANTTLFQRTDCTRGQLFDLVSDDTQSFVFVDAELWGDESRVLVVRPGPGPTQSSATTDTDAEPALFFSEKDLMTMRAPPLLTVLKNYAPPPRYLRELLKLEEQQFPKLPRSEAAVSAATFWAKNNETAFEKTRENLHRKTDNYRTIVYQCKEDQAAWNDSYYKFLNRTEDTLYYNLTRKSLVSLVFENVILEDCLNSEELSVKLEMLVTAKNAYRILGVVAAGAGVQKAAKYLENQNVALVSYDAQPPPRLEDKQDVGALHVGARTALLAQALLEVLGACSWQRVALLSEDTPAANATAEALSASHLNVRKVALPRDNATLQKVLRELHSADARVFVVNAGSAGTARALEAGAALQLTPDKGFAWVAREWAEPGLPPLKLLALRSAPRSAQEPDAAVMDELWPDGVWPARAAPLMEAFVTLALGFTRLLNYHPQLRYDHRTNGTHKLFRQNLESPPLLDSGLTRNLTFDKEGAKPPLVRLEHWSRELATPALYNTSVCPMAPVSDGTPGCLLPVGDAFAPTCVDWLVPTGSLVLLVAALLTGYTTVLLKRRALRRVREHEQRLRDEACTALLARQRGTVPALAAHHVDRARVSLLSALGTGRHGRVWLAELAPEGAGGAPRYVAAKEPLAGCSPAEESELLREAATLAPLRHPHVALLMGVCVAGGPPLVLSEPAFFGDLQRYLRARRPLHSAAAQVDGEAAHVSAAALTRLAREAALALEYLAGCGLVHCDVRAANCLVDERRSLKLADFGMARPLGTGAGAAEDEYACHRRKLFPVRWMAPESLTHGVFSPASDMWALGVLALELVTLGERPFGALDSPDAVALVKAGGHARLPAACSSETRCLAHACWRREAGARPAPGEVAAWLAARPHALAPSPQRHSAEDGDDDSGFGEAPAA